MAEAKLESEKLKLKVAVAAKELKGLEDEVSDVFSRARTAPSEVSQIVVKRAIGFTRKLRVPLVGIIENMSGFVCPKCGTEFDILGTGGKHIEVKSGTPIEEADRIAEEVREKIDRSVTGRYCVIHVDLAQARSTERKEAGKKGFRSSACTNRQNLITAPVFWLTVSGHGNQEGFTEADGWLKDVAPSDTLEKWFAHGPTKWDEFRDRYFAELDSKPQTGQEILEIARRGKITLLYSAKDTEHNNAVALKEYLERQL